VSNEFKIFAQGMVDSMALYDEMAEVFFVGGLLANTVLFVIQAIRLYKVKNSQGLSLITFIGFNLIQLSLVLHGIITKDTLLAVGYIFSFIACSVVTIMIPLYRSKNKVGK